MSEEYKVTPQGSLGLLALGHLGVKAWRNAIQEAKKEREAESNKANKADDKKGKK
jgi:hypothetical protein